MKLWVDDIRDAPDHTWTEVRKVEQAIRLIANFSYDVISLDHDIENRPDDETFKPIAYLIGIKSEYWRSMGKHEPKVIIHSINPVGAREMEAILDDYGVDVTISPYKIEEFNKKWGIL